MIAILERQRVEMPTRGTAPSPQNIPELWDLLERHLDAQDEQMVRALNRLDKHDEQLRLFQSLVDRYLPQVPNQVEGHETRLRAVESSLSLIIQSRADEREAEKNAEQNQRNDRAMLLAQVGAVTAIISAAINYLKIHLGGP